MKLIFAVAPLVFFAFSVQAETLKCVEESARMRQVELTYPDNMKEGDSAPCDVIIKDRLGKVLLTQPSICTEEEDVYFTVNSSKNGNWIKWMIYQDELYSSTLNFEVQGLADQMSLNCDVVGNSAQ